MARSLALLAPAALVLALTACGSGGGGSATPAPEHTQAGAGESTTDCVSGIWDLDTETTANTLLGYLTGLGAPVSDARADGPVVLEIHDDGTASYRTGVTYDFVADAGGVGMEILQSQIGSAQGEWGWAGSGNTVMAFTGWTTDVAVTNAVQIGGQAADFPLTFPDMSPGSTPLTVTCVGDTLTTKADQAPFPLDWARE